MAEQKGLEEVLRERVKAVRDSYERPPGSIMSLYLFLKSRPDYKQAWVRRKLGGRMHDWLVGLEDYGDSQQWVAKAAERMRARKEKVTGCPSTMPK